GKFPTPLLGRRCRRRLGAGAAIIRSWAPIPRRPGPEPRFRPGSALRLGIGNPVSKTTRGNGGAPVAPTRPAGATVRVPHMPPAPRRAGVGAALAVHAGDPG